MHPTGLTEEAERNMENFEAASPKLFGIKTGLALLAQKGDPYKFCELRAVTFDGQGHMNYSIIDLSESEARRLCSDLNNLLGG